MNPTVEDWRAAVWALAERIEARLAREAAQRKFDHSTEQPRDALVG